MAKKTVNQTGCKKEKWTKPEIIRLDLSFTENGRPGTGNDGSSWSSASESW